MRIYRFFLVLFAVWTLLIGTVSIGHTAACTDQTGLTNWWSGDANTTDLVGGKNGTLQGNAAYGTGEVGGAFLLDGNGSFVKVPDDPSLNFGTADFTVNFWVKFNSDNFAGSQVLAEKWLFNGTAYQGWTIAKLAETDGNKIACALAKADGQTYYVATSTSVSSDVWYHVALKRDAGTVSIFLNGVYEASESAPDDISTAASLKFGHRGTVSDGEGSTENDGLFLNGLIDEVQFSSVALLDSEIAAIYSGDGSARCSNGKFNQSVFVGTPVPVDVTSTSTFTVAATATSTLPVTITATGSCSGTGTGTALITMSSSPGACTVKYDQAGNDSFNAASTVTNPVTAPPSSISVPPTNSTGKVFVAWSASTTRDVTYEVRYSFDSGATWSVPITTTSTSATVPVPSGGTYVFQIKTQKPGYSSFLKTSTPCVVTMTCPTPAYITVPATNTTGSFTVSWGSSVEGATYTLKYRKNGGDFEQIYTGLETTYSVAGRDSGIYVFQVQANKDNFEPSAVKTSMPCVVTIPCETPAFTHVDPTSTGRIAVSWTSVEGANYLLQYSSNGSAGPWYGAYNGTANSTTATVPAAGTYIFRVKATKSGFGDSPYSAESDPCVVSGCTTPASITVPATNSTGRILVSWGISTPGATYTLRYTRDGVAAVSPIYTGTSTSTVITVPGNGRYVFNVQASKTGFVTSGAATSSACVVSIPCGAPTSLTVPLSNSTGSIRVSWGPSSTIGVSYTLEYTSGGTPVVVNAGTALSTTVTVTTSGKYTFRVKATKSGLTDSSYRTAYCAVTLPCSTPVFNNPIVANNNTGEITVSWAAIADATYTLKYSRNSGPLVFVYSGTNNSKTLTVPASGTYVFKLQASKPGYSISKVASSAPATVVALKCGNPGELTANTTNFSSTGRVSFTWTASATPGVIYTLKYLKAGSSTKVTAYTGTALSATVALGNGTYDFEVVATRYPYYAPSDPVTTAQFSVNR